MEWPSAAHSFSVLSMTMMIALLCSRRKNGMLTRCCILALTRFFFYCNCIQCGITPMCDSIVTKNAHWQWMHLLGSKKVISYQIAIWLPKCNLWSTRCILWSTQAYNVHFLVNDDVHLVCGLHLVTTNIGMSLLLPTLLFCKNSGSSGAISFWSWFHHRWQPTVHCTGAGSEKHYVTLGCNHMTFHVIQRCLPHNL